MSAALATLRSLFRARQLASLYNSKYNGCISVANRVVGGRRVSAWSSSRLCSTSASSPATPSEEELRKEQEDKDELDFMLGLSKETLARWTKMSDKEKRRFRGLRAVGGEEGGSRTVQYDGVRDNKVPRWYELVEVEEVPEASNPIDPKGKVYTVTLDSKRIVTRNNKALLIPSLDLANLVASDWETNSDEALITLAKMPIMQLVVKAIDDALTFRNYYTNELAEILACDLLCIRERSTSAMGKAQKEKFDPLIQWFEEATGLALAVTSDGMECPHPERTKEALSLYIESLDDFSFMAFHSLTLHCKSIVLAFALWHDRIDADTAALMVQLEEEVQAKLHGKIEGAHDLKEAVAASDISAAACVLRSLPLPVPSKTLFDAMGDVHQLLATKRAKQEKEQWERDEYKRKSLSQFLLSQIDETSDESARESLHFFAMSLQRESLPEGAFEKLEKEFEAKRMKKEAAKKKDE